MKSKVISFAEYDKVDISAYQKVFALDEKAVKKEMDFLKNKNSTWADSDEVVDGAIIVCDMKSENSFFNREQLKLMVGQGFFNKKLEALCVGMKKGTTNVLDVDGDKVTVTVQSVQRKMVPEVTDEMVKNLEIKGIESVEEYEEYLTRQQKKKIADEEGFDAIQYVMKQVFENSAFDLKKADWIEMIDHEIHRLQAIADKENLNLKTMAPEDFEGKMPFSSYHELLVNVQYDSWDKLLRYLLGCVYAKQDGVEYTKEKYRESIEDYMKFWHETKENAEKINTYEYSKITFFANYYYQKVRGYVEKNYFKEDK